MLARFSAARLSDARRRAGDNNDLAVHVRVPGTLSNSAKHQNQTSIIRHELAAASGS